MIICEHRFNREDPESPGYSMLEVDYYAWTPETPETQDAQSHRLTLRKNLKTEEFEFLRVYPSNTIILTPTGTKRSAARVIAFKTKDFNEALNWGNKEWNRHHKTPDYERAPDTACPHTGKVATGCPGSQRDAC